ncbi:MAG: hypothetical protein WBB37_07405 [bacterium]
MAAEEMRISDELREELKQIIRKFVMSSPTIKRLIGHPGEIISIHEEANDPKKRLAWLN